MDEVFDFPCRFPIKAFGAPTDSFRAAVISIVREHAGDLGEGAVVERESSRGRFVAMTITINATSREQLDAIYQALTDHPEVLISL